MTYVREILRKFASQRAIWEVLQSRGRQGIVWLTMEISIYWSHLDELTSIAPFITYISNCFLSELAYLSILFDSIWYWKKKDREIERFTTLHRCIDSTDRTFIKHLFCSSPISLNGTSIFYTLANFKVMPRSANGSSWTAYIPLTLKLSSELFIQPGVTAAEAPMLIMIPVS